MKFLRQAALAMCAVSAMAMLSGCGRSDEAPEASPQTTATIETEAITLAPTEKEVNEYEAIDKAIELLSSELGADSSRVTLLDINGDDYRTEYRLAAFKDAIGKKMPVPGGKIDIVYYGSFSKSMRVYGSIDTLEGASALYEACVHAMDPAVSDEEIRSQYNDSGRDINFVLGKAGKMSGFINAHYENGSLAGYEVMVDCSHYSN